MKKIAIVLAASLSLSLAAIPAHATQVIMKDGKLSGGYTVLNGDSASMNPTAKAEVKVAMKAEEAGGWKAEAELGQLIGTPSLGAYKVEFNDPLFRITAWGKGKSVSELADPFGFIKSAKKHNGTLKVRANVGPVTADLEDNSNLYLFGSQVVGGHTLGVAAHSDLPFSNGITGVGYGKTAFSNVELTGALGMTMREGVTAENIGFGVKAEAPVLPGMTAAVTYKSEPANFINMRDANTLKAEGKYETDQIRGTGAVTRTASASSGIHQSDVIEASGAWRGSSANEAWDDQFKSDKYHKNVAPAVEARVKQTRDNSQPATELTVKGTMPVIANQLWVNGSLVNTVDADGTLNARERNLADSANIDLAGNTGQMRLQADAYFRATEKFSVEPGTVYVSTSNDQSYLKLGAKAGYQIAPNGKLMAEYAQDYLNRAANDSRLGLGYEVKF